MGLPGALPQGLRNAKLCDGAACDLIRRCSPSPSVSGHLVQETRSTKPLPPPWKLARLPHDHFLKVTLSKYRDLK